MKILKTFNGFNKINEDLEPIETPEIENNIDNDIDDSGIIDDEDLGGEEGEEESGEYEGTVLLKELADKLGTEVTDNEINYNGKKINYYSETEKFHIGKEKFDTIEDVISYLKPQAVAESNKNVKYDPTREAKKKAILAKYRK